MPVFSRNTGISLREGSVKLTMQLSEDKVPAYEVVKEKIREIDNTIIITKVFYIFDTITYRFQLFKKEKMCMVELPKKLLDAIKNKCSAHEQHLTNVLIECIKGSDCWIELAA